MKYLITALAAATLAAQTPIVSISPHAPVLPSTGATTAKPSIGLPILGYIQGPGETELRTIIGVAGNTQMGGQIAAPAGTSRMYLSPRQHYALLENGDTLSIWLPAKAVTAVPQEPAVIPGALVHPDQVTFSSRAEAAVLYAKSSDRIQLIAGLPGRPSLKTEPGLGGFGEASSFAVSDDGDLLVAQLADGSAVISAKGSNWQHLAAAYAAAAWLFLPRTHSLVFSDPSRQLIALLDLAAVSPTPHALAQGIPAERLTVTRDGEQVLAASPSQRKVWTIDMASGAVGPATSFRVDSLLPLRDGHTFLLSASPALSLLQVPVDTNASH